MCVYGHVEAFVALDYSIHPPFFLITILQLSSGVHAFPTQPMCSERVAPGVTQLLGWVLSDLSKSPLPQLDQGWAQNSGPWDTGFFWEERKTVSWLFKESNYESHPAFLWLVQCKSRTSEPLQAVSALTREPGWGQSQGKEEEKLRGPLTEKQGQSHAGWNHLQPERAPWPAQFHKPTNSLFCLNQLGWVLLQLRVLIDQILYTKIGNAWDFLFMLFSILHILYNILSSVRIINIILSSPFEFPTWNIFLDYLYQAVHWAHQGIEKSVFFAESEYLR